MDSRARQVGATLQAVQQTIPPPDLESVARLHSKHAAVLELLGEYKEAVAACQRALELIRQAGDRRGEIDILVGLSGVYNSAHREESATIYSEHALTLARDVANTLLRWEKLDGIGPARYGALHQPQDAIIRRFQP